jgi:YegS/Rv2252/BmrU family lipid kinase
MRALLVLNEKSRRGLQEGDAVCRALEGSGIDCVRDPSVGDVEAVIAAGGDGTVISTVPAALARGVPLGIVPLGTFNDLARTLGVPLDIDDACAAIAAGRTRSIDVGRVNTAYFVNEASIGISTRIARKQTPEIKRRFGIFGIISTTLQTLNQTRPFQVELEYGDRAERFHTIQLTIANNGRFGGIFERPDAAIDDGWLDLYSVEVTNWMQALRLAGKIVRRDPQPGEGLRTRRSTRFVVRTREAHHIAADGEPAGMTPATFEILPRAVRVIIP